VAGRQASRVDHGQLPELSGCRRIGHPVHEPTDEESVMERLKNRRSVLNTRRRGEDLARQVAGVRQVDNDLKVRN
jgi:hypothetical protein